MLKLRDIMTTDVVTVSPDLSLRETMELFAQRHVSGAPVVAGSELVGVVSATDLMALASSLSGVPVREQGSDSDGPAAWRDGEQPPSNYFTEMWDDTGADASTRFAEVEGPEWSVLDEHTVAEAMTAAPVSTMSPDAWVVTAAQALQREKIHRLLVTQDDRLLGIVTTSDIARAVAEGKLVTRTLVFDSARKFDDRGWNDE
jgi:CBS domain-containing protein